MVFNYQQFCTVSGTLFLSDKMEGFENLMLERSMWTSHGSRGGSI